jgi:hypothetical protein
VLGFPARPTLPIALAVYQALWDAWDAEGRPAMAPGSTKQPKVHPLVPELRRQSEHVLTLLPRDGRNCPVWPDDTPLPNGDQPQHDDDGDVFAFTRTKKRA